MPVGFWPMDKIYKHRELTGRSRNLNFSDGVELSDSGPISSTVGKSSIVFPTKVIQDIQVMFFISKLWHASLFITIPTMSSTKLYRTLIATYKQGRD